MARAAAHAIPSKISTKLSRKESWSSMEEIKNLYSAPGEEVGGINNVLGSKEDVSEKDQHPLLFLREFTSKRADGKDNDLLKFPLPRILKGTPIDHAVIPPTPPCRALSPSSCAALGFSLRARVWRV